MVTRFPPRVTVCRSMYVVVGSVHVTHGATRHLGAAHDVVAVVVEEGETLGHGAGGLGPLDEPVAIGIHLRSVRR